MCILLDNIQHMDLMSWQYLCRVLNHPTIVLVMAMMEPKSSEDLSKVQNDIRKEKKIWKQILSSLQPGLMTPLACQFLNVYAIPQELERFTNLSISYVTVTLSLNFLFIIITLLYYITSIYILRYCNNGYVTFT